MIFFKNFFKGNELIWLSLDNVNWDYERLMSLVFLFYGGWFKVI